MVLIYLLVGLLALAGAAETVTVTGSTTVMPLVEVSAEKFNLIQDRVMVTVSGVGGRGWG